jgi:hypothetical protein
VPGLTIWLVWLSGNSSCPFVRVSRIGSKEVPKSTDAPLSNRYAELAILSEITTTMYYRIIVRRTITKQSSGSVLLTTVGLVELMLLALELAILAQGKCVRRLDVG